MLSGSKDPGFSGFIGVARENITPPAGIYNRNWGAAAFDTSMGLHHPLNATAFSFRSSETDEPLTLIGLDLGWWRRPEDEWTLRSAVLDALGSRPECVMINMSHTHAGPGICLEDFGQAGGELIGPYLEQLRTAVCRAAVKARDEARPAVLTWRSGWCGMACNRDLPDPQRNRVICGFRPDAPADGAMLVGRVTGENGSVLGTVVNYACHPTTLAWTNTLISPDWVGGMREVIEDQTEAPCLFLQGASGELAPRQNHTNDIIITDANGREVGFAALSVLTGMLPPARRLELQPVVESGAPLAVWRLSPFRPSSRTEARIVEVDLPLRRTPVVDDIDKELQNCEDDVARERLIRRRRVRRTVGDGRKWSCPVWIWRLGDSLLVGQANEAYSHLQTELRAKFDDRAIVVMNLVNGSAGYLPPRELYGKDIYQVWQSPFEKGSLEKMIRHICAGVRAVISETEEA